MLPSTNSSCLVVGGEGGRVLMIGLFASEDDLRESEAVLEQMNPPEGSVAAAIDVCEVTAEVRM